MQIHDVDLRLLRIFVAIVECGGLSAAESRLNIGRSTISSHLSDLEVRLGLTLCKRGRSGFELTEPGRVTYQASLELLQQCEAFANMIASSKDELKADERFSFSFDSLFLVESMLAVLLNNYYLGQLSFQCFVQW